MSMKTRRMSSKPVNKRQMKTSDRRKNIKSKPTAKGSGDMSKNSRSRSRILRKNKGLKTSPKKRVANKQSKDITIRRSSGRREKFSTERMAQTVSRSGVPFIMARDISKRITKRVKNRPSVSTKQHRNKNTPEKRKVPRGNKIITAGKVRQMVAEELIGRNRPDIANSYSGNPPENTTKHIYDSTVGKQQGIDKSSVDTQHSRRNEVIHDQSKRGGGIMT
jgi:transcriptional repressor NrdR